MKAAFFSDIHAATGNLRFLVDLLAGEDINAIYNLGDAVGYSGDTNGTFEILRSSGIISVMGNHDMEALARPSAEMTLLTRDGREVGSDYGLSDENKDFIRKLPKTLAVTVGDRRFALSHGLVSSYAGAPLWEDVTPDNMVEFIEQAGADVAFVGNSHEQYYLEQFRSRVRQVDIAAEKEFILKPGVQYVISTGSAAAPSGVPPKPGFVVCDSEAGVVTFRKFDPLG